MRPERCTAPYVTVPPLANSLEVPRPVSGLGGQTDSRRHSRKLLGRETKEDLVYYLRRKHVEGVHLCIVLVEGATSFNHLLQRISKRDESSRFMRLTLSLLLPPSPSLPATAMPALQIA